MHSHAIGPPGWYLLACLVMHCTAAAAGDAPAEATISAACPHAPASASTCICTCARSAGPVGLCMAVRAGEHSYVCWRLAEQAGCPALRRGSSAVAAAPWQQQRDVAQDGAAGDLVLLLLLEAPV